MSPRCTGCWSYTTGEQAWLRHDVNHDDSNITAYSSDELLDALLWIAVKNRLLFVNSTSLYYFSEFKNSVIELSNLSVLKKLFQWRFPFFNWHRIWGLNISNESKSGQTLIVKGIFVSSHAYHPSRWNISAKPARNELNHRDKDFSGVIFWNERQKTDSMKSPVLTDLNVGWFSQTNNQDKETNK